MPSSDDGVVVALSGRQSRRSAVQAGAGLMAALGAIGMPRVSAQEATPASTEPSGDSIVVQSFGNGMLFPTQGEPGLPPYTLYLWDANPSLFSVDWATRGVSVIAADPLLATISETNTFLAALVARANADGGEGEATETVWALRLVLGGPGSDAGSATYQGEPLDAADAAAWLGAAPAALPEGAQNLGAGYILIAGLATADAENGVRLTLE